MKRADEEKPVSVRVPRFPTSRPHRSESMPATPSDLFAFLERLGIAHVTVTHPALFTVAQSRELRGTIPGGHTKNLFLKDKKGSLFLVTALEDAEIELKSLHRRLGASGRFSFGPADLMHATLGIEPGAVTPFAAMNDSDRRVSVVLDEALMRHETVNCHPLVNTMTTSIKRADLLRFLEATGHPPRIVALAETRGAGAKLSYRLQSRRLTPFNWPYRVFGAAGARVRPRSAMPN
jgi:Ala-tRNA(Pro) deacylase